MSPWLRGDVFLDLVSISVSLSALMSPSVAHVTLILACLSCSPAVSHKPRTSRNLLRKMPCQWLTCSRVALFWVVNCLHSLCTTFQNSPGLLSAVRMFTWRHLVLKGRVYFSERAIIHRTYKWHLEGDLRAVTSALSVCACVQRVHTNTHMCTRPVHSLAGRLSVKR